MADALLSPAASLAARHRLERGLSTEMQADLADFLATVGRSAFSASPADLDGQWEVLFVGPVMAWMGKDALTASAFTNHVRGMAVRLRQARLLDAVQDTVAEVTRAAVVGAWSTEQRALALARALDPRTGGYTETLTPPGEQNVLTQNGMSWEARVQQLARTEATAAQSVLTLDAAAVAGYPSKRWVAHHDELVRPSHLAADGQTVPLSSHFTVDGDSLLYPGDPAGSIAEIANCRCVLVATSAPSSLRAAAFGYNPDQARAPRHTPVAGRWIDTPTGLLADLEPVTPTIQSFADVLPAAEARRLTGIVRQKPVSFGEDRQMAAGTLHDWAMGLEDYNWVDDVGGLPTYIKRISKHLQAKGMAQGHAIATAVNAVKKMCATGDLNFPGRQEVNPGSRAEACKAVAEWTEKKARAKRARANADATSTTTFGHNPRQLRAP